MGIFASCASFVPMERQGCAIIWCLSFRDRCIYRSHCVYVCGTSYKTGCKHCLAPATIVRDAKSSVPVAALCVVLHCLRSKSLTVGQGTDLHSSVLQGLQSWTSATPLCATTNPQLVVPPQTYLVDSPYWESSAKKRKQQRFTWQKSSTCKITGRFIGFGVSLVSYYIQNSQRNNPWKRMMVFSPCRILGPGPADYPM